MYFTEGRTDLPREEIGPEGSNCFIKGVRTRKVLGKPIVTCDFSGRLGPNPLSHFSLGPPMHMIQAILYSGGDKMEPYQIATTEDRSTIDNVPYDCLCCYLFSSLYLLRDKLTIFISFSKLSILTLCMLGQFAAFMSSADLLVRKKYFKNFNRGESISFELHVDQAQARRFVLHNLGKKCL